MRVTAALVASAVILAACTGRSPESSSTTVEGSADAGAMIASALGGTQSVQDFLIHLDMVAAHGDDVVSVMGEVVRRARSGTRNTLDLNGGFQIGLVESLEGWATDATGARLDSVASHFALIEFNPLGSEEIEQRVLARVPDLAASPISEALFTDGEEGALLVQIATASYDDAWTHVGIDDTLAIDLSFLPDVVSATDFASVHLFGQTLPGDPSVEAALTAHELFAYRWNQGLVRLVGDQGGAQFILARSAVSEGLAPTASRPTHATSPTAGFRVDARGPILATAAIGLAIDGDLPGPENDPGSPPGTGKSVADPGVVRLAAKTFHRTEFMAAAYRAGEAKAEELLREVTARTLAPDDEDRDAVHITESPPHCIFRKGEMLVVGKENRSGSFPGGCEAVFQMPIRAYPLMWAMKYESAACRWSTVQARIVNRPSTGARGGNGATTGPGSTSTTLDPLFPPPTAPQLPSCDPPRPRRGGGTVGDVHVITFDQLSYGNQAAGEFLVFDNGVAAVQMRTEPWEDSDIASVATAIAVEIGGRRVSMHRGGATWIDGEPAALERGMPMSIGDGALAWTGTGWVVVWSDGTRMTVDHEGSDRVLFTIHPSDLPIEGMLGDGDSDPDNDLVTRDGTALDGALLVDPPGFYEAFIDSWRIMAEESLFHYGPGESTEGFQLAGFPDHTMTFEDLVDDGAGEAAEEACRSGGITRSDLLAICVYDLVVTGDESFVYDHFVMQESLPEPPESPEPTDQIPDSGGVGTGGANLVMVGDLSFEFEAFAPSGWCTADDISLGAAASLQDASGRQIDISIQYVDGDDPLLSVVVQVDRQSVAWLNTMLVPPTGSVDEHVFGGGVLTVTGSGFANKPFDPGLSPNLPLPTGASFVPFGLEISCDS